MGRLRRPVSWKAPSSLSLPKTFTTNGVSCAVVKESSTALGGSFTDVTVTLTVAVSLPPWPSEIV